jgi:hypothetical protein
MNELGITLVWSIVQITIVAGAAVVLSWFVSRRGGGIGTTLPAFPLHLILILTLLAFCPLPGWWVWSDGRDPLDLSASEPPATPVAAARATTEPTALGQSVESEPPPADGTHGAAWSFALARLVWDGLIQSPDSGSTRGWHWPALVAGVILTGTAYSVLRLMMGLWSVRECRRRSGRVEDAALLRLLGSFRSAMGCTRPVELRECPGLASPATVGWRHPVVLLPEDWPFLWNRQLSSFSPRPRSISMA